MSANEPRVMEDVEKSLALNVPFSDWRYIDDRTRVRYEQRLNLLLKHLPAVAPLLAALKGATPESRRHVLGDAVVRSSINHALGGLETHAKDLPLDRFMTVFEEATRYLNEGRCTSPTQAGARRKLRIGPAPHHAWVWCDEREDDAWAHSFRELFDTEGSRSALRTPDETAMAVLTRSVAILEDVLPLVSRSVLNHTFMVAVTDVPDRRKWDNEKRRFPYLSFTTRRIPGTAFLCMSVLRNPYDAAEHLLHEGLHLKLYDLQHTHSILKRGYQIERSPLIRSLWNSRSVAFSREWPVCRSLAAMHVYVYLALYFARLEHESERLRLVHGPLDGYDPAIQKRRAFERARYLGSALRHTGWEELGIGGQRLVDWLLHMLEQLGAGPSPDDGDVHLFLDLYERQINGINRLVEHVPHTSAGADAERSMRMRQLVSRILRDELGTAERLASTLGITEWTAPTAPEVVRILTLAPQQVSGAEMIQAFRITRGSIASLLRGIPPERFSRVRDPRTEEPLSELVRDMVEASDEQLELLSAVSHSTPSASSA